MMIYSFDIFDTCLVRKCGAPKNVFELLSMRVFRGDVSSEVRRTFVASRIEAEAKSWSEKQSLDDIYDALQFKHPQLLPKECLKTLEMKIEQDMLVPVCEISSLLNSIHEKNEQVLFISDMYLPSNFLQSILEQNGLWRDGDRLYVSCECGATKASGRLFQKIQKEEHAEYKKWNHYGDNRHSDYVMPRRLGIKAHLVNHTYTPYQHKMNLLSDLCFQYCSILGGMSRCIALQTSRHPHKDFFIDIIAPLFTSFVFRVLKDAANRGIDSLYFCSRDAYPLYRIAMQLKYLFPCLSVHYLYISRKSLYEGNRSNKLGYYAQIGLASKNSNNAIVDIRSRTKTLRVLNDLMLENDYKALFGYFFEICPSCTSDLQGLDYYTELDGLYISQISKLLRKLPSNWYLYELFFPLNTQKRTIGYDLQKNIYVPIFESEHTAEYSLPTLQEWVDWREWALNKYVNFFVELELYNHADEIFVRYAIPQLADFLSYPHKHYLNALVDFCGMQGDGIFLPYIDTSLLRLPLNVFKHKTMWKRGTIFATLPIWLCRWLYKNK